MRLGQMQPNKTRPVLISIKDIEHRNIFLSRSKNLCQSNAFLNNVFIAPDYMAQVREENRKLIEELRARKNNCEEWLTIRRGKIVPLPQHQMQTHLRI